MTSITKGQVRFIFQILTNIKEEKVNALFAYYIAKNISAMREELLSQKEFEDNLVTYEKERVKLCEQCADKDGKGNPIIERCEYQGINTPEFNKELEELVAKYDMDNINKLLNEFADINFIPLDIKYFKDINMSVQDMTILMPLIEDNVLGRLQKTRCHEDIDKKGGNTLIPVPAETNKKIKEKIRELEKDINNHKTGMGNPPSIESGMIERPDPTSTNLQPDRRPDSTPTD